MATMSFPPSELGPRDAVEVLHRAEDHGAYAARDGQRALQQQDVTRQLIVIRRAREAVPWDHTNPPHPHHPLFNTCVLSCKSN